MNNIKKTVTVLALGSSLIASASTPAFAETVSTAEVQIAHYDLDLSTQIGANVFASRVEDAADRVCARSNDRGNRSLGTTIATRRDFNKCVIGAVESAASQLDAPVALAALGERFPNADIESATMMADNTGISHAGVALR